MSDLVKRLRMGTQIPEFELRQEAADEIERLRAVIKTEAKRLKMVFRGEPTANYEFRLDVATSMLAALETDDAD